MKREIPEGGRAERIAFARGWIRVRRADEPGVRLSRGRRRLIVAGLYLLLLATVSALSNGSEGALPAIGYFQTSFPVSGSSATTRLAAGRYMTPFTTIGVASELRGRAPPLPVAGADALLSSR